MLVVRRGKILKRRFLILQCFFKQREDARVEALTLQRKGHKLVEILEE